MELQVSKRQVGKKGETKRLRRAGKIPVILYGPGHEPHGLAINSEAWAGCLRGIPKGNLSTSLFELKGEEGSWRVLVKDIQYHPTTYDVTHLDFLQVSPDVRVNVRVPIRFSGVAECVGVKEGGVLRQVIRSIRVDSLPGAIPQELVIDVADLGMGQSRSLGAIEMPEGVNPLAEMKEVAVVIAKR